MHFLNFFRYSIVLEAAGFGFFSTEPLSGEIAEIVSCSFKKLSFPRDKFVGMNIIGSIFRFIKEREEICTLTRVSLDFYVVMVVVRHITKHNFLEFASRLR